MNHTLINPANEEILRTLEVQSAIEVEGLVNASFDAFGHWRKTALEVRLNAVAELANSLSSARVLLSEAISQEMGKTVREALQEVDKCAASCVSLTELYPRWLKDSSYSTADGFHVSREPLGPVLGIMPWNYPLWQVIRFAVPGLLSGNSILLKHAPNTWGVAELIEDLFKRAFPDALYANLRIETDMAGKLIADARVRGVSLTGSRRAGMSVGAQAGVALKKCVLELGGSDAYVVLDDADVEFAAEKCTQSRLLNSGQSCVSAKRFIVTRKNVQSFSEKMRAKLAAKKFGDPMHADTDFGPMARKDLRDQLHEQVERSVASGAKLVLGGEVPVQKGFYYPSTLLLGVQPGQPAFDEELFGPVAAIIEATSDEDAIRLANQSRYGLGGAIFSRDIERARKLATQEIEAGMVFVNDFVRSDVSVPFGGVKESGLGRELGREGCLEFTNIKTIYAKPN